MTTREKVIKRLKVFEKKLKILFIKKIKQMKKIGEITFLTAPEISAYFRSLCETYRCDRYRGNEEDENGNDAWENNCPMCPFFMECESIGDITALDENHDSKFKLCQLLAKGLCDDEGLDISC